MPRNPSIPPEVARSIVRRWLRGDSAQAILNWLEQTNARRKHPVHTTRSSINRLIERVSDTEGISVEAHGVRRLRALAATSLDALDDMHGTLQDCLVQAQKLKTPKDALNMQLRALSRLELFHRRNLKISALSAERLESFERHNKDWLEAPDEERRKELRKEMEMEGEAITPEKDPYDYAAGTDGDEATDEPN